MKELIDDYKRRIETLTDDLRLFKSTGSINDIKKVERLTTKLFEYRTFVSELERIQANNNVPESYFQIVHTGYQTGLEREEIQIHGGKNANIFLIKTDEGFVIDVYGQNDIIDTMAIFEDDLNEDPLDELEESGAPKNFSDVEVKEFKDKWGQMHNEVCRELGYPLPHTASDDLLMVDFFWIEKDRKWYPKNNSMYTEREQAIATYLRLG